MTALRSGTVRRSFLYRCLTCWVVTGLVLMLVALWRAINQSERTPEEEDGAVDCQRAAAAVNGIYSLLPALGTQTCLGHHQKPYR